jgi:hypothetical protein
LMGEVKQLIYHHADDPNTEEPLVDFDDTMPIPREGDKIERNGRSWTVVQVVKTIVVRPTATDVYRIYLMEAR